MISSHGTMITKVKYVTPQGEFVNMKQVKEI